MNVKNNRILLLAMTTLALLILSGCSKYDDGPALSLKTKTARLTGDWEVVSADGKSLDDAFLEEIQDGIVTSGGSLDGVEIEVSGMEQSMTIEKDGAISIEMKGDASVETAQYSYDMDMNMTMDGEWEWNDDKTEIEITIKKVNGETVTAEELEEMGMDDMDIEIVRLTNKELHFKDEEGTLLECEKM